MSGKTKVGRHGWVLLPTMLAAQSIAFAQQSRAPEACGMQAAAEHTGHGGKKTSIRSAPRGVPSLYYRANMDVNTDGAARSYHPDDPNGTRLAFNNMANAITAAWDARGRRIDCDRGDAANRKGACYEQFIAAFEGARRAGYAPGAFPRIKTTYIIPWKQDARVGWAVPCTIGAGPYSGYFVSQTSQSLGAGDACEQSRYVDSLSINAVVLPKHVQWRSQGIVTDGGDLVVVRNRANGRIAYALHGDRGPPAKIGEGSIALTAALTGATVDSSTTYASIKQLAVGDVDYVVFPSHDVVRHYAGRGDVTQARIDEFGRSVFDAWGGVARLDACAPASRP